MQVKYNTKTLTLFNSIPHKSKINHGQGTLMGNPLAVHSNFTDLKLSLAWMGRLLRVYCIIAERIIAQVLSWSLRLSSLLTYGDSPVVLVQILKCTWFWVNFTILSSHTSKLPLSNILLTRGRLPESKSKGWQSSATIADLTYVYKTSFLTDIFHLPVGIHCSSW